MLKLDRTNSFQSYSCTLIGADLNRKWHETNQWQCPILWAVKEYIIAQSEVSKNSKQLLN